MKATTIKKTITYDPVSLVLALCLTSLRPIYVEDAKRIVRSLATFYGLTVIN